MIKMKPNFYLPFPLPYFKESKEPYHGILWLQQVRLVKNHEQAEFVIRTASEYLQCCYPDVTYDLHHDFVDFASWNCVMDDIMESDKIITNSKEKIEILSSLKFACEQDLQHADEVGIKGLLVNTLIDVKGRIKKHISIENYNYIMCSLGDFFSGIIWEISSDYIEKKVTLNTYCMIKTKSVGVLMAYALSLALYGLKPNVRLMNEKKFIIMMNCILFVMAIDNDLYSFNKEKTGKGRIFNIIDILQQELNIDLFQATSLSISLRNRFLMKYISLRGDLSSQTNIKNYSKCLECLIAGNVLFGNSSLRYVGKQVKRNGSAINIFSSASYDYQISVDYCYENIQNIIDLIPSISWWLDY